MGKILFFGGKGGVGKTSCSGAYAVSRARQGQKVLLVSTDPAHSTSDLFETPIGSKIVKLAENLYSTEINPEEESEKYIERIRAQVNRVYSPIIVEEIGKQLDNAKISPGSHEAALFDRMIELINETSDDYDYIIFDTAPTGHTLRLLTLPNLLESWIDSLLAKRQKTLMYKEMYERDYDITKKDGIVEILMRRKQNLLKAKNILLDSGRLGFIFVLNAEKLAIDETKKATDILKKNHVPIAGYVVNRILPEHSADDFWKQKKQREAEHLREIEQAFGERKIYKIPLLPKDMSSQEVFAMAEYFMN
ncbi:MAG: ArsA family ATPase [Bacillota bacterium]|nr:ArsA family ATPase [Bacillota bacterium]